MTETKINTTNAHKYLQGEDPPTHTQQPMMTLNEYQQLASRTAQFPTDRGLEYTTMGLFGEAGEIANKVKKIIRGDYTITDIEGDLIAELGDVLWYVAMTAKVLGYELDIVAHRNVEKLASRAERGTIKGNGDNR